MSYYVALIAPSGPPRVRGKKIFAGKEEARRHMLHDWHWPTPPFCWSAAGRPAVCYTPKNPTHTWQDFGGYANPILPPLVPEPSNYRWS